MTPEWQHWHPVAPSRDLTARPLRVELLGEALALFRDGTGRIGALHDVCPHRRMALSQGEVIGGRLRCRYHGWAFAPDGAGESPAKKACQLV